METRELICIGCPLGCPLRVTLASSAEDTAGKLLAEEDITVSGNTCRNGEIYAKKEVLHPERMLTSTVPVEGGKLSRVPVKTKTTVPKEKIFACMEEIRKIRVKAPVAIGDVLLADCAGTGVPVVAAGNCIAARYQ